MAHEDDPIQYYSDKVLFEWAQDRSRILRTTRFNPKLLIARTFLDRKDPNVKEWSLPVSDGLVSWIEARMEVTRDGEGGTEFGIIGLTDLPDTGMGSTDLYWRVVNEQVNPITRSLIDVSGLSVAVVDNHDGDVPILKIMDMHGPGSADIIFGPKSYEEPPADEPNKTPSILVISDEHPMPDRQEDFDYIIGFWATAYSAFLGSLYAANDKILFYQQLVVKS